MGNGPGSSGSQPSSHIDMADDPPSQSEKQQDLEPGTSTKHTGHGGDQNECIDQFEKHARTVSHSTDENKYINVETNIEGKAILGSQKGERPISAEGVSVDQTDVDCIMAPNFNFILNNQKKTEQSTEKEIDAVSPQNINHASYVKSAGKNLQQENGLCENKEKVHNNTNCSKPENSTTSRVECKNILSAYEIHRPLEPSCTQPTTCEHLDKSGDEVQETLTEAISKLKQGEDWCLNLGQISKTIRSCTCPEDAMKILIEENFLGKLEEFLELHHVNSFESLKSDEQVKGKVWPVTKRFLIILWITCDKSVNFCQYLLRSKLFLFLLTELRCLASLNYEGNEVFLFIIKSVLGILHNISRHVPNSKWNLRNEGLVTILRTFLPSEVSMVRLKSLIVLSYLLSEAENEIINSDDDNFVFVFNVLADALTPQDHKSSKYGMSASEVLKGISNLAINDENKIRIVRNGGLPLYQEVLNTGFPDEIKITIMTLWSLAFHHYNKKKMREMPGIMGKLYELRQCEDEEICHAARGTFWELENTSKSAIGKDFSSSAEKDPSQPHIMISYQWDCQPIMLKVKDRLKHAGYKVWMDVEHMSGSTLEAMALAVEKAAVVLICMSEKYKNSPNCRTEAEYVYRLRKDFVPLRLQQEYVPDGWLGILVGTRLYFDMHTEDTLDSQLPKLLKELSDRGRISPAEDELDLGLPPRRLMSRESMPVLHQPEGREVMEWSCSDVVDWLQTMGLTHAQKQFDEIDGQLLLELQKVQKSAPEFFYTLLKTDFQMSTVIILKFSRALRGLR